MLIPLWLNAFQKLYLMPTLTKKMKKPFSWKVSFWLPHWAAYDEKKFHYFVIVKLLFVKFLQNINNTNLKCEKKQQQFLIFFFNSFWYIRFFFSYILECIYFKNHTSSINDNSNILKNRMYNKINVICHIIEGIKKSNLLCVPMNKIS